MRSNLVLVLMVVIVAVYSFWTLPAHAAPLKQPSKVVKPEPKPEKLLPIQRGEEIIMDPRGYDHDWKVRKPPKDWNIAKTDPFVWA